MPPKKDAAATNAAAKIGARLIQASGLEGAALLAAVDANLDRIVKAIRSPGPHAATAARIVANALGSRPSGVSVALRNEMLTTATRSLRAGVPLAKVVSAANARAKAAR